MRTLFYLSHGLLQGIVVIEALVLHALLREVLWVKRLYLNPSGRSRDQLPARAPMPEFSVPILGTDGTLDASSLRATSSMLLFVSPREPFLPSYEMLKDSLHSLWHKANGRLFLVCQGSEEGCREFADRTLKSMSHPVPVLLDGDGHVAREFRIKDNPEAVIFDDAGRLDRYGHPLPPDEEDQERRQEEVINQTRQMEVR